MGWYECNVLRAWKPGFTTLRSPFVIYVAYMQLPTEILSLGKRPRSNGMDRVKNSISNPKKSHSTDIHILTSENPFGTN